MLEKGNGGDSPKFDQMDEESITNAIPIQKFKPNQISKKEKFIDSIEEALEDEHVSPSAGLAMRDMEFKNIDHPSFLSAVKNKLSFQS